MRVRILVHHGGSLEGSPLTYNGGETYDAGRVDTDFLTLVDIWDVMHLLGYTRKHQYWYLFDNERIHTNLKRVSIDEDVIDIINKVESDAVKVIHIYVEHWVDKVVLVDIHSPLPALTKFAENEKDDVGAKLVSSLEASMEANSEAAIEADVEGGTEVANQVEAAPEQFVLSDFLETDEDDEDVLCIDDNNAADNDFVKQNWFGGEETEAVDGGSDIGSDASNSDILESMSEGDEEGEGRGRRRYPEFHDSNDLRAQIHLHVGLKFRDPNQFKKVLKTYSIQKGFEYNFVKNDKVRVRAECKRGCGWKIYASFMNKKEAFQIKTFDSRHQCGNHYYNKRANVDWIANHYLNDIRDNPNWLLTSMVDRIRRDFNIEVKQQTCYRARRKALSIINGKHAEHYQHSMGYAEAVMKWNPGSTVMLVREGPHFQRLYVCIDACKRGFIAGCRPIIAVDGCHLKGGFGGQLLVGVGKDANDDMYPIAYAICEAECKETWTWFLTLLLYDIGSYDTCGWTFMSDRQKGLLDTFEEMMSGVEHRYCIRHLHANMKSKRYSGKAYKDVLWGAARAANEIQFNNYMNDLLKMNPTAYQYLAKIDPAMWSRHAFRHYCKSDMLLNNLAECFNSWIKDSRDKPILTMLEMIRRQLMVRFHNKREGAAKSTHKICPKIQKKLERNKDLARDLICRWQGRQKFEVDHYYDVRRIVDLKKLTCTCGRWQLNGIPCPHSIVAIYFHKGRPEDYVHVSYHMDTYRKAYDPPIHPMPGPKCWKASREITILPPIFRNQPGRPRMARRRAPDEPQERYKVTKQGYDLHCSTCKAVGHNARTCPQKKNKGKEKATTSISNGKKKKVAKANVFETSQLGTGTGSKRTSKYGMDGHATGHSQEPGEGVSSTQ